jgi:hypothetical protein
VHAQTGPPYRSDPIRCDNAARIARECVGPARPAAASSRRAW